MSITPKPLKVPKSSGKLPNINHERAALLLAEDRYTDAKIAELCGVTERALGKWKKRPEFAARVKHLTEAFAERALRFGLARRERRLAVLSDVHDRMLCVIEDRAKEHEKIPGGKSGLLVRQIKGIGKGDDFQLVEQYQVDTALVRELRGVQEQIARELGQWRERHEMVNLNELFERMTREEMEAYAKDGTIPSWFPALIPSHQNTEEG